MLWSLVGIEALYTKGEAGLAEQVKHKSQAFLGRQDAYKKEIAKMYDFRSRFVHGDLDFPGYLTPYESEGAERRYQEGLKASNDLATAVLVASIQELIRRDCKGLDFSYAVGEAAA